MSSASGHEVLGGPRVHPRTQKAEGDLRRIPFQMSDLKHPLFFRASPFQTPEVDDSSSVCSWGQSTS